MGLVVKLDGASKRNVGAIVASLVLIGAIIAGIVQGVTAPVPDRAGHHPGRTRRQAGR